VEFTIHVVYAPDGEIWKKVPGTSVFLPRQRVEHALRRAYRKSSPKRALAPEETFLLPHQLKAGELWWLPYCTAEAVLHPYDSGETDPGTI